MSLFGTSAFIAVAVIVVVGIVIALVAVLSRSKNRDWAGDARPPHPPVQPPQPPGQPPSPPRTIDDSQQFREQNRPTDPPPPA